MINFGWWTTGRDKAAVELLNTAIEAIEGGRIRGKIAYIFLSRDKGESIYSDDIIEIAKGERPLLFYNPFAASVAKDTSSTSCAVH